MKYIIFKVIFPEGLEQEFPIIFPSTFVHSQVAANITKLIERMFTIRPLIVAAGDILLGDMIICNGKSETLQIESRVVDSALIQFYEYTHGII